MTIAEFLAEMATDEADLSVLTDKMLDRLMGLRKAELRAELYPIVYSALRLERRGATRIVERAAAAPVGSREHDATAGRRDILSRSFFSPAADRYVAWGDATVEDHQSYADYLRTMAAGTIRTAEMHERAVAIIAKKRVACLSDLGEKFDPKELES